MGEVIAAGIALMFVFEGMLPFGADGAAAAGMMLGTDVAAAAAPTVTPRLFRRLLRVTCCSMKLPPLLRDA